MRAALYARVSTSEREELQDPENQLIRLRDYCRFRQWDIVREYVEYESGRNDNRPILADMLKDAQRGRFDYIVVFKLDRLTRSPSTLVRVLESLKKNPRSQEYYVNVVSTEEGLDTSSPLAAGMMTILSVVASWEVEGFDKRRRAGIERAQKHGTRSGKPFGRPPAKIPQAALAALDAGESLRSVSRQFGISLATLSRRSKTSPPPALYTDPLKTGESQKEVVSEHSDGGEGEANRAEVEEVVCSE
jgi:DNA invertase Pin-like site-specific DNA recombinase